MNASPPRPHPDDEVVSAVLDGMATPDERAHVEQCAACTARLEELRAVSVAIGAPTTTPAPGPRDAAIAAAVAARTSTGGTVTPIRPRRRQPPAWLLGVAAAFALIALAVPLVGALRGGSGTHKSASSAVAPTSTAAPDFSSAPPVAAGQNGANLGALDDVAQLDAAVQSSVRSQALAADAASPSAGGAVATTAEKATATTAARSSSAGCGPPAGTVVYTGRVVWRGTPATVYGLDNLPPGMHVVVVADGSCQTLVTTVV